MTEIYLVRVFVLGELLDALILLERRRTGLFDAVVMRALLEVFRRCTWGLLFLDLS